LDVVGGAPKRYDLVSRGRVTVAKIMLHFYNLQYQKPNRFSCAKSVTTSPKNSPKNSAILSTTKKTCRQKMVKHSVFSPTKQRLKRTFKKSSPTIVGGFNPFEKY